MTDAKIPLYVYGREVYHVNVPDSPFLIGISRRLYGQCPTKDTRIIIPTNWTNCIRFLGSKCKFIHEAKKKVN